MPSATLTKEIDTLKSRNDEDDVLLLEIACEKLLHESELLSTLMEDMKKKMPCSEEYETKLSLLHEYVSSKETYSDKQIKELREKLVSKLFFFSYALN
jgi:hypothetical protein